MEKLKPSHFGLRRARPEVERMRIAGRNRTGSLRSSGFIARLRGERLS